MRQYFDVQLKSNDPVTQEAIDDLIDKRVPELLSNTAEYSREYIEEYVNYMNSKVGKRLLMYAIPKFIDEYDKRFVWSDEVDNLTDLEHVGYRMSVPLFKEIVKKQW